MVYVELSHGTIIETDSPELWKEGKRISKAKGQAKLAQQAREYLAGFLRPGMTISCVLRSVSSSGMYRRISLFAPGDNGEPVCIDGAVINLGLGDRPRSRHGSGVGVGGCGMDMGFALVSHLSATMFPKGFGCIGKGCPSNDHMNGDRDYTPHDATLNAGGLPIYQHWHRSGDYALRHKWL